jgi:hypothetical protein
MLVVLQMTARQMKVQQQEIEWGERAEIGRWLRQHMRHGDTVYLEPVGYIGYFSDAHILDFPGLVTPAAVRRRREEHRNFATLIDDLQPDWAVMRPQEVPGVYAQSAFFRGNYAPVKLFDVRPSLAKYESFPGKSYIEFDAAYILSKKVIDPGASDLDPQLQAAAMEFNRQLFPMMKTSPILARSRIDFGPARCRGRPVLVVEPEGTITFRAPPGAKRLNGRFGILPEATGQGDRGTVEFVVEFAPLQGKRAVLFNKLLVPARNSRDREMQDLDLVLPGTEGTVLLWTRHASPSRIRERGSEEPAGSYWTEVEVH